MGYFHFSLISVAIVTVIGDRCIALCSGFGFFPSRTISHLKCSKFDPNEFSKSMTTEAIDKMKNSKPDDIDRMLKEFDNMNPVQRTALKAMNMDTEMMKKTMEMLRDNPNIMKEALLKMEKMSLEELMDQSRKAQQQIGNMSPEDLNTIDEVLKNKNGAIDATMDGASDDDKGSMETGPASSSDNKVIDAMYTVAEYMSNDPTRGGVTLAGFYSLPVIQLLSGDREFDLSMKELKECWDAGGLGQTRINRDGFERIWREIQEYFEEDIMEEARKESRKSISSKKKRPSNKIGDNFSQQAMENVNNRVKNLSDDEVGTMLKIMKEMDPVQETRLKNMGVDPKLMQETAALLQNNPAIREQAKKMMQNMSPEDMLKASQDAQRQMSQMSKEDIDKAVEQLKNQQATK